jgi:uncharacterized caspase-like protein
MRLLALIWLLVISAASTAHAEKRVALVIGNAAYKNAVTLQNPRNDATDVSEALKRLGFETIVGFDLDKAGMEDATIKFARAARDADVALVYYSGHAMQRRGINYLMPVDAELRDDADLRRLIRVDDVVEDLSQAKNLRILVLDSCRVNPLADELSKAMELTRGPPVDRGIARMIAPKGMIISFATQPNQTAADGQGRNSPYTIAFLKNIEAPEEIGTIFHHMTADVYNETQGKQLPELSLSVVGDFYLKGRPETTANVPMSDAERAWAATQSTTSQAVLEDFVRRYGDSFYGTLARARLEELKRGQVAVAQPITPDDKPNVQRTLGMQLANLSGDLRKRYKINDRISGVVITDVDSSSVAAEKRLSAGDVIVEVAQEAASDAANVQKRIDKLKKDGRRSVLLLVISPNGETQFVALSLQ